MSNVNSAAIHDALRHIDSLSTLTYDRFMDNSFETHTSVLSAILHKLGSSTLLSLLSQRDEGVLSELRSNVDGFQREANAKEFRKIFYYTAINECNKYISTKISPIQLAKRPTCFFEILTLLLKKAKIYSEPIAPKSPQPITSPCISISSGRVDNKERKKRTRKTKPLFDFQVLCQKYKKYNDYLLQNLIAKSEAITTATSHLSNVLTSDISSLNHEQRQWVTAALSSLNKSNNGEIWKEEEEDLSEINSGKPIFTKHNTLDKQVNVQLIEEELPVEVQEAFETIKSESTQENLQSLFELLDEYSTE
ncbi:hypothetical protein P9112_008391 [Eukaryota sp. TZLM1-RC]